MKNLNLNTFLLEDLTSKEIQEISGGDTIYGGYNDKAFLATANAVSTAAGAVVGFVKGLFSL